MKRWWWAVALGTLAIGFIAGMLAGPGYWMGRGGYAKPLQPGYGPGHDIMMAIPQMSGVYEDMARDTRVRRFMETALQKSLR